MGESQDKKEKENERLNKGYLILESGDVFCGVSFGSIKQVWGEIVFCTGMVGYLQSLTDPSYYGQILIFTYPLIGNYGVPPHSRERKILKHFESNKIHVRGLVVDSYIENNSHWQSKETLGSWLKREKIPALSDIDTRLLTKTIRKQGVMKCIITFEKPRKVAGLSFYDINKDNLVKKVSCRKIIKYNGGAFRILLLDCGLKFNQIRLLLKLGVTIIRAPWNYDPFSSKRGDFDAIVISNGPGDPKITKETISVVQKAMKRKIPMLGVCLGNQIMALAAGANTYKLKYGHRSQNQPVIDRVSCRSYITTQNHGYAVDANTLPEGWKEWFTNLNDSTNEGIRHNKLPFFSTQFHPEATPGPLDTKWLFGYFIEKAKQWQRGQQI